MMHYFPLIFFQTTANAGKKKKRFNSKKKKIYIDTLIHILKHFENIYFFFVICAFLSQKVQLKKS